MDHLAQFLPKDLINEVYEYVNPYKNAHKWNMKKTFKFFDIVRKVRNLVIGNRDKWSYYYRNGIYNPTVSEMKKDVIEFIKERRDCNIYFNS